MKKKIILKGFFLRLKALYHFFKNEEKRLSIYSASC
jgi:hypothetical protein